jgi:hypothetical protein
MVLVDEVVHSEHELLIRCDILPRFVERSKMEKIQGVFYIRLFFNHRYIFLRSKLRFKDVVYNRHRFFAFVYILCILIVFLL